MSGDVAIHKMPSRFVLKSSDEHEDDIYCCPVCACPHVHARQVSVEQGRTLTEIENETTTVLATDHGETYSGSVIALHFWCERGHAFHLVFRFENGEMKFRQFWQPNRARQYNDELWRADRPAFEA